MAAGEERQADFHLTAIPSVHLRFPRTDIAANQDQANERNRPQRGTTGDRSTRHLRLDQGFNQMVAEGGPIDSEWDFGGLTPGTYEVRIPVAGRTFSGRSAPDRGARRLAAGRHDGSFKADGAGDSQDRGSVRQRAVHGGVRRYGNRHAASCLILKFRGRRGFGRYDVNDDGSDRRGSAG